MRLLLVEDDSTVAAFVRKGLTEEGFVVDHAGDGASGLALASSAAYDAAVIDVMLPATSSKVVRPYTQRCGSRAHRCKL